MPGGGLRTDRAVVPAPKETDETQTFLIGSPNYLVDLCRGRRQAEPPPTTIEAYAVARYLHTMYRITDPEASRGFYEALGFTLAGDFDIVRDGQR